MADPRSVFTPEEKALIKRMKDEPTSSLDPFEEALREIAQPRKIIYNREDWD